MSGLRSVAAMGWEWIAIGEIHGHGGGGRQIICWPLPVEPDCVNHDIIGYLVRPCNCSGYELGSDQAGGRVGISWKNEVEIGIVGENIMSRIEGKLEHMLWQELDGFSPGRCCFRCGNPHHLTLLWPLRFSSRLSSSSIFTFLMDAIRRAFLVRNGSPSLLLAPPLLDRTSSCLPTPTWDPLWNEAHHRVSRCEQLFWHLEALGRVKREKAGLDPHHVGEGREG